MSDFLRAHSLRPLPRAELDQLLQRARRGDAQARDRIVRSHIGLVLHHARRWRSFDDIGEDLVAEGLAAVNHAIDRWRTGSAAAFATYAGYWITAYMRQACAFSPAFRRNGRPSTAAVMHQQRAARLDERVLHRTALEAPTVEQQLVATAEVEHVRRVVSGLREPLRTIARLRLLAEDPPTLEAVGARLGCSRERVRNLQREAERQLRLRLSP